MAEAGDGRDLLRQKYRPFFLNRSRYLGELLVFMVVYFGRSCELTRDMLL